jgi:hypothetical protein
VNCRFAGRTRKRELCGRTQAENPETAGKETGSERKETQGRAERKMAAVASQAGKKESRGNQRTEYREKIQSRKEAGKGGRAGRQGSTGGLGRMNEQV